ncbi:MAG: glycoside hydrolase family protein [Chloroflexota bacterium]|nr:glycoside hydrolase family protein [Chloroflexota bacterium]
MAFHDRRGMRHSIALVLLLLLTLLPAARTPTPASAALTDPYADRDGFFGVVGRDPYYEWNTDTVHFNNDVNKAVLENIVKEMAASGAKWVRIEFFAEYGDPSGPGRMPYEKYDWFLTDLCKRYNMNVLGLLSYGIVRDTNYTYALNKVNDPTDRQDGSNPFIRGFADRAAEIAGHYAGYVNAWEIINEPNSNSQLDFITKGQQQRIFPERMAAIMSLTYPRLKGNSPNIPVVLGGLINTPGAYPDNYDIPYLRQMYNSPLIKGHGGAPWDVVADHPYDLTAANIPGHVRDMHTVMEQAGEGFKKIWVTEFGMQAAAPGVPESGIIPVTDDEAKQSAFLNDTLSALNKMRDIVERAFWFKLEDFTLTEGNQETHWGLFAFRREGDHPGEPWPRKDALRAYASIARPSALPTAPEDLNKPTASDAKWFPDTKHWIAGPFRLYWERNGGIERFGLPRTSVYTSAGRVVQIFERARFEFHDEFAGTPNEVLLTLLGNVTTRTRTFSTVPRPLLESDVYFPSPDAPTRPPATPTPTPSPTPSPTPKPTTAASGTPGAAKTETATPIPTPPPPPPFSGMYFAETSHTLTGPFLQFWKQGGGLPVFGYPISEPIVEKNADDGKSYTVQYFERTRLEYHPEFKDNPLPVLEGLLGNDLMRSGGWWR